MVFRALLEAVIERRINTALNTTMLELEGNIDEHGMFNFVYHGIRKTSTSSSRCKVTGYVGTTGDMEIKDVDFENGINYIAI